jgi:pimeloyl-ACP methyl ester carboxylesterase
MERLPINGVEQSVWIRDRSGRAPVLILLHGGPGASESALFRHYNAELEEHFLVIYWEQRATGRSFDSDIPDETMTIAQFVDDLDVLVDRLRERFAAPKVALLGHSWGSAIGLLYAERHPDKLSAFVGTGQVASMPEGEAESYAFALSQAKARGDGDALEELAEIGPPPHDVDAMLTSRKWVERFGGSFHADLSTGSLVWAALGEPEANVWDLVLFGRGNRYSLERLWPEFSSLRLMGEQTSFDVPIFFILGRYDEQVPARLAAAYFDQIQAPRKRLFWLEGSAHNAPFEEPTAFDAILIERVLPVVKERLAT